MSEYKKVKIGDFLEQYRNTIWIDDSVEYGQITISSKDGVKFRCLKIGKEIGRKRQFVIDLKSHPNTVIFTRQGIADGSIGIAPSNVNGCIATENMPMFSVNENIILVEYLEHLLISPVFKELVATITPSGSAQKSIHERDLLQLEITIPDLETQKEIVKKVSINLKNVETLTKEIESQKAYAKQLRQNILQDAIEGKLTAEWRKTHPVIKGNPDFDAEALFEQIQKEKKSDKKQKELASISDDEKPFQIPEGWKWVRLGEISESCLGKMLDAAKNQGIPRKYLRNLNVRWFNFDLSDLLEMKIKDEELERCSAQKGDLLICEGGYPGRSAIWNEDYNICFQKAIHRVRFSKMPDIPFIFNNYLFFLSETNKIEKYLTGEGIQHLTGIKLKQMIIPLMPLSEQKEITQKIQINLAKTDLLEKQISQREEYANQLMQSILKEAFEEK